MSEVHAIDNARFYFSSRHGGCSAQPYNECNIGAHVGDDRGDVIRNRELLHREISLHESIAPVSSWPFLNQTHENNLVVISASTEINNDYPPRADASITTQVNQPLVVMTADCGPLVLTTPTSIAVVHASYRSVASGIIASVVEEMHELSPGQKISGVLGPCIHPDFYEFTPDLLDELVLRLGEHVRSTTLDGRPAFDLPRAIAHECTTYDVEFSDVGIDTYQSPDHFSYRRDGVTGRQGVIAWLV